MKYYKNKIRTTEIKSVNMLPPIKSKIINYYLDKKKRLYLETKFFNVSDQVISQTIFLNNKGFTGIMIDKKLEPIKFF